jgi:hypothetical protein
MLAAALRIASVNRARIAVVAKFDVVTARAGAAHIVRALILVVAVRVDATLAALVLHTPLLVTAATVIVCEAVLAVAVETETGPARRAVGVNEAHRLLAERTVLAIDGVRRSISIDVGIGRIEQTVRVHVAIPLVRNAVTVDVRIGMIWNIVAVDVVVFAVEHSVAIDIRPVRRIKRIAPENDLIEIARPVVV